MLKGLKKEIYTKIIAISSLVIIIPSIVLYFLSTGILTKMVGGNLRDISARLSQNFQAVVMHEIEQIEDLISNPFLINNIEKANKKYSGRSPEDIQREIKEIDKKWVDESLPQELIDSILKNPVCLLLKNNIKYNISYMELFVTDKMGALVASTNKTTDYYQADETWWQKAYNNGKGEKYIDKIGFDTSAEVYSLDVCLPIREEINNSVIGVAKVVMSIEKVINPMFFVKIGETGSAGLITSEGTSIINRIGLISKINNEEFMNKIRLEKEFFISDNPLMDVKMIYSAINIKQNEFYMGDKLYILISQHYSEAIKPVKRFIFTIFLVGFIALMVVFYFGRKFISRLITVINTIQEGINTIGYGKISVPVITEDRDELDNLTLAFNNMAKAIKERDRLKVDKSELETISKELIDKNVELGEFIYSISHDLRAPVVSISGYSSILVEEYADKLDEEGRKYLKRISENTAFMEQLIHDLIDLSRAERINYSLQDVNVSEILEVVSSQFSEAIRKMKINFVVKSGLKKIYADKIKIIQVFNNIIGNAIKYVDPNKDPYIEVGGEMEGEFYQFYVKDNGIGISNTDKDKIFKLFYRVEGTGITGTGVGLNIVKKIVERHQGKIWIESELGKGTTFYFSLYKSLCDINEKYDINEA